MNIYACSLSLDYIICSLIFLHASFVVILIPLHFHLKLVVFFQKKTNQPEKGLTSELHEILRWSDHARMLVYDFIPVFDKKTPILHGACYFGHIDIVKIICKYISIQFDILNTNNVKKLSDSEMNIYRNVELIKKLNFPMISGHSPLYLACQRGFIDIVKFLVRHGANPTVVVQSTSQSKYTPLSVLFHTQTILVSLPYCF